jgi:hypothetical protein
MGFFQSGGILNRRGFFGGAAKAFSPADISGLQLWLDATTGLFDATSGGSAVTTDGSAVARWEDQSGNNRHITQATSANRPILKTSIQNSKNIIRFDGTNDHLFLSSAFVLSGGSHTIFCVLKGSTQNRIIIGEGNSSTIVQAAQLMASGQVDQSKIRTFYRSNTNSTDLDKENYGIIFNNTFRLACLTDTGTLVKDFINGINSASNSYTRGTYTFDRFCVGGLLRTSLVLPFVGDIAEIIIYNSVIQDSDISRVQNYLNLKWAIY